jgi:hypothetical protein
MYSLMERSARVDSADHRAAATVVCSDSMPTTNTYACLPSWETARLLPPTGTLPSLPLPLDHFGHHGRALICAADIVEGRFRAGCSLIIAPGERVRLADGTIDHRFTWRVAVYLSSRAEPLRDRPVILVDRSLSWVVRYLCESGDLFSRNPVKHPAGDVEGLVVFSVAWVAHNCRDVISWHLARLRPHVDRPPHPRVVAEVAPLLREQVLDAARVFGQVWVAEVLGEWGHLATPSGEPTDSYLRDGHAELDRHLRLIASFESLTYENSTREG